jgi:2-oxo-3-hexenedioate decarboxylase
MASSAEVMEHPAEAVALLVKVLSELGEDLPTGSFVMSGAIAAAIPVQPGDYIVARYQDLGSISVRFI